MFFVWLGICLVAHAARTLYERHKFKKGLKKNRLIFIFMLIDMILLWMSFFNMCESDPTRTSFHDMLRYAGLGIVILGGMFFFIALFTIRALENYQGSLLMHGIYAWSRHPMYLSFILWMVGYTLFMGAVASFFISFVLTVNILYWRSLEEQELEKKFGGYLEYKKSTWF
jgi:protein-S-isoprenylcysteine O-methyltransferase Ste14